MFVSLIALDHGYEWMGITYRIGMVICFMVVGQQEQKPCSAMHRNEDKDEDHELETDSDSAKGAADTENNGGNTAKSRRRLPLDVESINKKVMGDSSSGSSSATAGGSSAKDGPRFPSSISAFATGMAVLDRKEFAEKFDTGVPLDKERDNNNKVLLMYSQASSLPKNRTLAHDARKLNEPIPHPTDIEAATANCDFMSVILTDFSGKRAQCIAIMGQYEAYHIQKFMRLDDFGNPLNSELPLRYVNRGAQASGRRSAKPPKMQMTLSYWETLGKYITQLPEKLDALRPVAGLAAAEGGRNAVTVMVCNHGQSELLLNFVCSAKKRNLQLGSILLFATDMETKELAENLGLHVFMDKEIFGEMPKEAAQRYADPRFTKMMMAKVYCVQMVMMLGYDVLFQDVDVVWFKDPFQFFQDNHDHDMYFQDDGNHALYYGPYSANTGFYYVRNTDATRNFFNALLLSGDLIMATHSHQVALIALLNEHASLYGIQVKILSRDTDTHPGGYHFHNRKPFMKALFAGKVEPDLFHMSWTASKVNKVKFFRQMGEWYVQDSCVGETLGRLGSNGAAGCCLAEANVTCHYRDKPSKIQCPDSPNIDTGRRSFW